MHMIENINGKDCFAFVGQKAWHGLGTEVPADISPLEMMQIAGLDWKVEEVDTYYEWKGKKIPDGNKNLIRDIDGQLLTTVSGNWNPCQNEEAFDFFNDFVEAGDMTMNTAGSLNDGKMVWALARVKDDFELFHGDEVKAYLLFSNPHEYGKSINIKFVAERVVCANTIAIALSEKSKNFVRISHRKEFDKEMAKELLGISHDYMDKYKETAAFLGSKKYTAETVKEYMMEVFPIAKGSNPNAKSRKEISKAARQILENVLNNQPGMEYAPNSWWNVVNSVTFYTNHLSGRTDDSRLGSLWYGTNADVNLKALDLAMEYAKIA